MKKKSAKATSAAARMRKVRELIAERIVEETEARASSELLEHEDYKALSSQEKRWVLDELLSEARRARNDAMLERVEEVLTNLLSIHAREVKARERANEIETQRLASATGYREWLTKTLERALKPEDVKPYLDRILDLADRAIPRRGMGLPDFDPLAFGFGPHPFGPNTSVPPFRVDAAEPVSEAKAAGVPACLVCGAEMTFVVSDDGRGVEHKGQRGWWMCSKRSEHRIA